MQLKQEFPIELQVQATLNELKHDGKLLLPHSNINLTLSGNLKKQTTLFLQTQGTFESIQGKIELYSKKTPFDIELKVINGQYPFEKLYRTIENSGHIFYCKEICSIIKPHYKASSLVWECLKPMWI